ncbi:hypothetical protein SKAU_G00192150 [Synaphobranchus kaupii]|uniref:Uncharacterized protein n=1 Tax=Synaphobranchus kaupii TaxID=118154 RepID=A0A9Q1FDX3_SYNKA|nr:hypothetical protein SKAU_G00192150 [Synaphobranchus kaupii]
MLVVPNPPGPALASCRPFPPPGSCLPGSVQAIISRLVPDLSGSCPPGLSRPFLSCLVQPPPVQLVSCPGPFAAQSVLARFLSSPCLSD